MFSCCLQLLPFPAFYCLMDLSQKAFPFMLLCFSSCLLGRVSFLFVLLRCAVGLLMRVNRDIVNCEFDLFGYCVVGQ